MRDLSPGVLRLPERGRRITGGAERVEYGGERLHRAAREALGTKKEDTWVFEDAYHAAKTAADDGFPVAALFDASEDEQDALKKTATLYLRSFEDALPFREEMFR